MFWSEEYHDQFIWASGRSRFVCWRATTFDYFTARFGPLSVHLFHISRFRRCCALTSVAGQTAGMWSDPQVSPQRFAINCFKELCFWKGSSLPPVWTADSVRFQTCIQSSARPTFCRKVTEFRFDSTAHVVRPWQMPEEWSVSNMNFNNWWIVDVQWQSGITVLIASQIAFCFQRGLFELHEADVMLHYEVRQHWGGSARFCNRYGLRGWRRFEWQRRGVFCVFHWFLPTSHIACGLHLFS